MDDSGLLNLLNVELISEKSSQSGPDEEEGTFSKLGSTISKLFSGLYAQSEQSIMQYVLI